MHRCESQRHFRIWHLRIHSKNKYRPLRGILWAWNIVFLEILVRLFCKLFDFAMKIQLTENTHVNVTKLHIWAQTGPCFRGEKEIKNLVTENLTAAYFCWSVYSIHSRRIFEQNIFFIFAMFPFYSISFFANAELENAWHSTPLYISAPREIRFVNINFLK